MNVFNRIAISLLLVAFVGVALLISLLPKPVIGWLRYALDVADYNMDPATQLVGAILGLLMAALAVLLLVIELRPPARQSVVVAQVAGGIAELTNESVALRVKKVSEAIAGVRDAVPVIRSHGKAVEISLRLVTDPDIDIPQKSEEVMQAVRSETETKMGIPIKSLRITVRHGTPDRRNPRPGIGPSSGDAPRV